jgi:hypothetical protein
MRETKTPFLPLTGHVDPGLGPASPYRVFEKPGFGKITLHR